jgi:coproporphyrinogen III oxidase
MVRKWATFTYSGSEVLSVTRCVKKYINIAFKTNTNTFNTLGKFLTKGLCKSNDSDAFEKCGVYKSKFGNFSGVNVGQTGRNFKTRFKKHISDIMHNRENRVFTPHINYRALKS